MSRYFSEKYSSLVAYTPGEQPQGRTYIKLNTNESPFPPSPTAQKLAKAEAGGLQLYSDPKCTALVDIASKYFGIDKDQIIFTNSSDEILNFAFMSFCDKTHPAYFPDITYGFYPVFAELNGASYTEIPLRDDFTIDPDEYIGVGGTIFIANPNAPTGIPLPLSDIERIVRGNPGNVVVVDEAYVDFGGESAIGLINKYDNLLVTRTFSKSRSMAGARLGFGIACKDLIQDLNTIKYSTNPYSINRSTMAAGVGSFMDEDYFVSTCEEIKKTRAWTADALRKLGFTLTDSRGNFVFAKHPAIDGEELYLMLKERGILVRHFSVKRIWDYNRITVGSMEDMQTLVKTISDILEEKK